MGQPTARWRGAPSASRRRSAHGGRNLSAARRGRARRPSPQRPSQQRPAWGPGAGSGGSIGDGQGGGGCLSVDTTVGGQRERLMGVGISGWERAYLGKEVWSVWTCSVATPAPGGCVVDFQTEMDIKKKKEQISTLNSRITCFIIPERHYTHTSRICFVCISTSQEYLVGDRSL